MTRRTIAPPQASEQPSKLQRDLLPRIVDMIRQDGLEPGSRLPETALARRLQVSDPRRKRP